MRRCIDDATADGGRDAGGSRGPGIFSRRFVTEDPRRRTPEVIENVTEDSAPLDFRLALEKRRQSSAER
jgi:hypothetical protein